MASSNRYLSIGGPPSVIRKSRVDGKISLLPKPRPTGSIDRPSIDVKRPSGVSYRSSSAEPPRATLGGRLSREASATKIPVNRRSRSQTCANDKTPLRSNQNSRNFSTPNRTPSKERGKIDLHASLDRVMAFCTVKDQRQITNISWQRAECTRMNEALTSLDLGVINRPLTISRFVEIVNELITHILRDPKLNNETYVTKLPHLAKRLLYPGAVSKSWLRTVNTLHAFPHALALITYLTDLLCDLRRPVHEEWLFINKDDVSCLRRGFLNGGWEMFNSNTHGENVTDRIKRYIEQFKQLVGFDEQRVVEEFQVNKKYTTLKQECDAEDVAQREKEEALSSRLDLVRSEIKAVKIERRLLADKMATERTRIIDTAETNKQLAAEIERLRPQQALLRRELAAQTMSVQERDALLDKLDFNKRVVETKRTLAEEITKELISKENELALAQNRALESCAQYKQGLLHVTPVCPHLASLAVDESEVMTEQCVEQMTRAVEILQREQVAFTERKTQHARTKTQLHRRNAQLAEETRSKISETMILIKREQQLLKEEMSSDTMAATAWSLEEAELKQRSEELQAEIIKHREVEDQLVKLQERNRLQKERVSHLKSKAESAQAQAVEVLERSRKKHQQSLRDAINKIKQRIPRENQ